MEWDIGSPWYRPTRICHATSGGDFGWRSGNGKWPVYYPDSVPPVLDIGPGLAYRRGLRHRRQVPREISARLLRPRLDLRHALRHSSHTDGASFHGEKEEFGFGGLGTAAGFPLQSTNLVYDRSEPEILILRLG
ncbi:MAG: hypothetical protein WDN28_23745 [Chthoniobacter sp.]